MTPSRPTEDDATPRGMDWAAWRALGRFLLAHPRSVAGVIVTGALTAMVDATFPLVTRSVIDELAAEGPRAVLWPHGLAFFALVATLATSVLTFITLAGRLSTHVAHDIRRAGFERLQELSFSYYDRRPVGWLMARMTSDCDRLARILAWGLLDLAWGGTLVLTVASVMVVLSPGLSLTALSVVPVLAWVSLRFQRVILQSSRRVRRANSRLTAAYNETIMGVRTSKVAVREGRNTQEFGELSGDMLDASVRNALQSALYLPVVLTLGSVATGLALWLGGAQALAGALTLGTLVAFVHYTTQLFEPIQEVAGVFAQMQMAQAAAERVLGLIATEPEIRDAPRVRRALADWQGRARPVGVAIDGGRERLEEIAFRGVSFAYAEGEPVLCDFDLTVRAGETVALVGSTGGGKSTIVGLLCRFYEPTAGSLLLDGVDYRERSLAWWQSQLGIVLQEPQLFSGTVRENIRYGRLDATDEEIEAAARIVGAHEFIARLPDGYDAEVGSGGDRLSTGQKQLVSFARALVADPQVLVMDEATSSVDTETEQRMQRALAAVLRGRTCFVIAHRLSTVRSADRILVIEGGRIVEEGTHAELLAARGRYHELCAEQRMGASGQWEAGSGLAPIG